MKFILGKKIEMSQVFDADGKVTPVTVVEAGPCVVTQTKTKDKDGYDALQTGFGAKKKINKPLAGHLKDLGKLRWLREFHLTGDDKIELKLGDKIEVTSFQEGDLVRVVGISKGKGFQGVVKRHGFHGASATHGTKHALRSPGSIGATHPSRVWKGRRMAGRMGNDQVTLKKIKVIKVVPEANQLFLKGAIPGRRGTLLKISTN